MRSTVSFRDLKLTPDQLDRAWREGILAPALGQTSEAASDAWRGLFLDGLPALAARRIPEEKGKLLTVARVVSEVLKHDQTGTWRVSVQHQDETAPASRSFLLELARRLLALGCLVQPQNPTADPLLNPALGIDKECICPDLTFARAVTAVEMGQSGLLVSLLSLFLNRQVAQDFTSSQRTASDWFQPLLGDLVAQCLLVVRLAVPEPGREKDTNTLLTCFLRLYGADARETPESAWPPGPLAACCALGWALVRPREEAWRARLRHHVRNWPGWEDENHWPIRHPGRDIADFQRLLTDRLLLMLRVGDRKLWRRDRLDPPADGSVAAARSLRDTWPALDAFCFVPSSKVRQ